MAQVCGVGLPGWVKHRSWISTSQTLEQIVLLNAAANLGLFSYSVDALSAQPLTANNEDENHPWRVCW